MMSTLTAHYQWEDEMVRKRTGHPPSYAKAKKMKSPNTSYPGWLKGWLKGLLFFFSFVVYV